MLLNYLKIAWRNIKRKPIFSVINITGLAIGLAACIIIGLWVQQQLSYDRFHKKSDRIYRLFNHAAFPGGEFNLTTTPIPLATEVRDKLSSVEKIIRVSGTKSKVIKIKDQLIDQNKLITADPGFFQMFTFPLLRGNDGNLLQQPGSIVLTKTTARKYFPDGNAVGQTLKADGDLKTVTGVVADPPPNSSLNFSIVETSRAGSEDWESYVKNWHRNPVHTFLQVSKTNSTKEDVASFISKVENNHFKKFSKKGYSATLYLQPLTDIHLGRVLPYNTKPDMPVIYVWVFIALALFILLLASINYTNLATARGTDRSNEVGIRKTLGAKRSELVGQFFGEASLTCLLSLLIALVVVQLILPSLNKAFSSHLMLGQLGGWIPTLVLLGLMILLVVGSGWYPALLLSGFSPHSIFKSGQSKKGGITTQSVLVIFQFTVAIVLIIATTVVYKQLSYMRSASLGFNKDRVVLLQNIDKISPNNTDQNKDSSDSKKRFRLLKNELKKLPNIQNASLTYTVPSQGYMRTNFQGMGDNGNIKHTLGYTFVDENYLQTLGLSLTAGRNFSNNKHVKNAVILNEAASNIYFGNKSPIGKKINMNGKILKIVGTIKNFHFKSLRYEYEPLILFDNHGSSWVQQIAVKLGAGGIQQALDQLKNKWQKLVPNVPFNYSFLDQQVAAQYKTQQKIGRIFTGFTILAIIVACLGLFGLTTYAIQQRTKEIGVRKVLGASVTSIVQLLSKDFLKLVALGFVIAVPIGWYAMNQWLQNFAYRIDLSLWVFVMAGGISLIIALVTVSWQSVKAALANPVDSLRDE